MIPWGREARSACEDKCLMSCSKSSSQNKGRWMSKIYYSFTQFCFCHPGYYKQDWYTRMKIISPLKGLEHIFFSYHLTGLSFRYSFFSCVLIFVVFSFMIISMACSTVRTYMEFCPNNMYVCFLLHISVSFITTPRHLLPMFRTPKLHLAHLHLWNLWPWVCRVFTFFFFSF